MHMWDILLPQDILTLNKLHTSRINPKISAGTHLDGQYEYSRAPMEPPGTRIIAHEMPNSRCTWSPHGQDGWYIGPALEHSCCYIVYINKTRSERVVETVDFSPTEVQLPFQSTRDLATEAAKKLTYALGQPTTGHLIRPCWR
jgi:predicted Abi (CAAX) family protease